MMRVGWMGKKGLLFSGIGVGVGRAGTVHTETTSHQGSPTKPIAPPTQAVRARPAGQKRLN